MLCFARSVLEPASHKLYIFGRDFHEVFASFLLQDSEYLVPIAHLSDYNVYRIPNAKRVFGAPFEWGACLRPNSNAEDTKSGEPGIKVIAFENEKSRACWLTAMRLAKVSDTIFLPAFPRPRRTAAFYPRNTQRGNLASSIIEYDQLHEINFCLSKRIIIFFFRINWNHNVRTPINSLRK